MSDLSKNEAIMARRLGPDSSFTRFRKEDIEQSIPDRFRQQVAKYPDRPAIKTEEHQLTYRELNEAANRVAHAILALCGEGEECVTLLLEHGASVVIGIFGVLKAGKTYVSLDASLPRARNAYILEDSQTRVIVTDSRYLPLAEELADHTIQVLNIDEIAPDSCDEDPDIFISPDTLAFIVYTSGTTGQPKGVVENHRNLLHEVMILTNLYRMSQRDRVSLIHSCSYRASTWYLFPVLLNGACIYPFAIMEEGTEYLSDWLIQEGITLLGGRMFVREVFRTHTGAEKFPSLRLSLLGGDSIYRKDVEACRKTFSNDHVMIVDFSSTEAGVISQYFIDRETEVPDGVMPVGYVAADKEVLILDDDRNEVGVNQIGEIAVKSRYISPGYWRRPDLTEAKFLPDPEDGDERIYLTGDLGRMLPDGCLICLGREDFQVKIRGYRVEIGEVEAALLNLDNINKVAVLAREDLSGDRRLVAYINPERQPAPTVSILRRSLAEKLPDYIIPAIFVFVDAMPMTATSKIDRRKLPAPSTARPELDALFVAPQTPIEETLTGIWAEILELDQVGIHDNFFDLGGNSLQATQIVSRVTKTFQVKMSLRSVLQSSTVADMAAIIAQDRARNVGNGDVEKYVI
ncbi:amino acid adenylation domain-containing protein [Candidatus Poribacteria bacterium]